MTDYRVEGRCFHELRAVRWLLVGGLLAACEDFAEIYDDACAKQAVLAQWLSLPAGIPWSYPLQRVFSRLNPVELEAGLPHGHWDVTVGEAAGQTRAGHAPRNLSTLRKLARTLLRRASPKRSLKRKRKKAAREDTYTYTYLRQLLAQLVAAFRQPDAVALI